MLVLDRTAPLKHCPIPIDKGTPVHAAPETPGITFMESAIDTQEASDPRPTRGNTARPPHLRQVINPPIRFGDAVVH